MAKQVSDTWERGDPYERYVGRWSREVAPEFLSWLRIPAGRRWLDIGCGTGALAAAILDRCAPATVTAVEPSRGFRETALRNLSGRAAVLEGGATQIPLADGSMDVVVSGLVLNFVPEVPAALREMSRVAAGGGTLAAYVWDYAGKMQLMRAFWDAAVALDRDAASLDEGKRFPLCRADALVQAFAASGLHGVDVTPIDIPTRFASFDDFWQPFLGGQGPAPAYAMSLADDARARLRDRIQGRLKAEADGSISLLARAWAVRGSVRN
jgi:SAM-dependent methyltransferase